MCVFSCVFLCVSSSLSLLSCSYKNPFLQYLASRLLARLLHSLSSFFNITKKSGSAAAFSFHCSGRLLALIKISTCCCVFDWEYLYVEEQQRDTRRRVEKTVKNWDQVLVQITNRCNLIPQRVLLFFLFFSVSLSLTCAFYHLNDFIITAVKSNFKVMGISLSLTHWSPSLTEKKKAKKREKIIWYQN